MSRIVFDNFSCYYKVKKEYITALDGITLEIPDGQFVAVVGESGSGKTTLLKSILGFCDYIDGDLTVNGIPIEKLDTKNGIFAYVKQEIALYPNLTVYDNIAFPLNVIHTSDSETDARVTEIARQTGIDWLLTRKPRQLSWGQQQRVAIARALIKRPQVALFDEPFANIDASTRIALRRLVRELHEKYGMTTVFVTHELDEAFAMADRIIVLEKGKVVDDDTQDALKRRCHSDLLKISFLGSRSEL